MKNVFVLWIAALLFSTTISGQELKNLDYAAPFHEGMAAVKKGGQWGFINTEGQLVIDFRNDIVVPSEGPMECCANHIDTDYPFFMNNRCIVKKMKDGIAYYGYINSKGETVIDPIFINASHFKDNMALALKLYKENIGRNEVLGKNVVSYSYNEVVIDTQGKTKEVLRGPINLQYSKKKLRVPPTIKSHFLNANLVAVPTEKMMWEVYRVQNK